MHFKNYVLCSCSRNDCSVKVTGRIFYEFTGVKNPLGMLEGKA